MNIFLTGGTGFIGQHLCRALWQAGHQITLYTRQTLHPTLPNIRYIQGNFSQDQTPEDWLSHLEGIDIVINCVGIIAETAQQRFEDLHYRAPIALFQACTHYPAIRVIQISALGADEQADTAYHRSKRAADVFLQQLDLEWYILRPSIVYGQGGQSQELFMALAALPLVVLPDGGQQKLQPIAIDDLVQVVHQCVMAKIPAHHLLDVVGPEILSLRQILSLLRHWLGEGPLRVLSIPYRWLNRFSPPTGFLSQETFRMLQRGNTADITPLIQASGFTPQSLSNWLAIRPAQRSERRQARVYFLIPLLRWSIALTWLSAGIISAFFYPQAESYALLAQTGIPTWAMPFALYGACTVDIGLGIAVLMRWQIRLIGGLQIVVMSGYTAIITWALPQLWLHPFGPIVKNFPLLMAILVYTALEKRK